MVLFVSFTGCTHDSVSAELPSPIQRPSVSVTAQVETQEHRLPQPTLQRSGLNAPVVWRRPPQRLDPSVCSAHSPGQLTVVEVRADYNRLYIDTVHDDADDPEADHPGVGPDIDLLVDRCPVGSPHVTGSVWKDWSSPSTLTVALSDLPDGELEITLTAFNTATNVFLKKMGTNITDLPKEERTGYALTPGDPARGTPGMATLGLLPDCLARVGRAP